MYYSKTAIEQAMSECGIYCPMELWALMERYTQESEAIVMPFGKYKGLPAKEVAKKDPGYAKWCIQYLKKPSDFDNTALINELTL
jgi:hypothetical protein